MIIHGKWYFQDLGNKFFFGTLNTEDKNIFRLNILADFPKFTSTVKFPVIYGETPDGNITLLDCLWKGSYKINHESHIIETRLTCRSIIRGFCLKKVEDLKFNTFKFNFDGLKEWVDSPSLTETYSYNEISAKYKNPEPIKLKIGQDINLTIEFEMDSYTPERNDVIFQINQSVYLKIICKKFKKIEYYITLRNKIVHFFLFIINRKVEPYIQRLYSNSILNRDKSKKELIFFENTESVINKFPNNHVFPFQFNEISNLTMILNLWFVKYEDLKPITNIFQYFLEENLNIENKFILVCQALETFHTRFMQKNEKYHNNEKNSYGPFFKVRMERLLKFYYNNITKKTFSKSELSKFPEKITNSRHYFTHFNKVREQKKWSNALLHTNTPKLILMLHSLVLNTIDIPNKIIKDFADKKDFGKYIKIKDISNYK